MIQIHLFQENGALNISPEDRLNSVKNFIKHLLFVLRISKNLVFCLRKVLDIFNTDKKYKKVLRRYGYWIRIPYLEINRLSSLVLSRVLSLFYFL
jgi:hypothetical protein